MNIQFKYTSTCFEPNQSNTNTHKYDKEKFLIEDIENIIDPITKKTFRELIDINLNNRLGYFVVIINQTTAYDGFKYFQEYPSIPSFSPTDKVEYYYIEPPYDSDEIPSTFNHFSSADELQKDDLTSSKLCSYVLANDGNIDQKQRSNCQNSLGIFFEEKKEIKKALHYYLLSESSSRNNFIPNSAESYVIA
jgi:hypothetical protein